MFIQDLLAKRIKELDMYAKVQITAPRISSTLLETPFYYSSARMPGLRNSALNRVMELFNVMSNRQSYNFVAPVPAEENLKVSVTMQKSTSVNLY